MKLFTLEFVNIYYDEKKRLIEYRWKNNTEKMNEFQYRETVENLLKLIRTFEPKYIIGVLTEQNYIIPETTIKWINEYVINEILKSGVKKFAFINTNNFILKNIYSSFLNQYEQIKIFDDRNQAIAWFLENNIDNNMS